MIGKKPRIPRPNLDLAPGTYRMRNGHTAEITSSTSANYENPKRVYVIWIGRCIECNQPISWLAIGRGLYGIKAGHAYDLVEMIALAQPAQVAA